MGDDEEPAALLTQAQRAYLRGEKDYRPSVERQVKTRIRRRVQTALETDFALLADEFDLEENASEFNTLPARAVRETISFAIMIGEAAKLKTEPIVDEAIEQARNSRAEVIQQKLQENPDDVTLGELSDLRKAGVLGREEYEELYRSSLGPATPGRVSQEELAEMDLFEEDE